METEIQGNVLRRYTTKIAELLGLAHDRPRSHKRFRADVFHIAFAYAMLISLLVSCTSPSQPGSSEVQKFGSPSTIDNGSPETGSSNGSANESSGQNQNAGADSFQQDDILRAQANQEKKVQLIFSAPVCRLLRDDTKGMPHQHFLVQLNNGSTVMVAHNIRYAPRVPVSPGSLVTIKGEYIWTEKGGIIHWTHRSDTPRHEGGYIEFGGKRYE